MGEIGTQAVTVERVRGGERICRNDVVIIEEPLEIRVLRNGEGGLGRVVSVTMRTPGHDMELALGFLYCEGLIRDWRSVSRIRPAGPTGNVVRVELKPGVDFDFPSLDRNFYTSSSCGICGKASIESATTSVRVRRIDSECVVGERVLHTLVRKLQDAQEGFTATGGSHAIGIFTSDGNLLGLYEDVGRHNAMDKLIGSRLIADSLPLSDSVVLLSGRASFELVQKAAAAGVSVLAAIGAPSSLAIELAAKAGITLVAFLREDAFNIYSHSWRVVTEQVSPLLGHQAGVTGGCEQVLKAAQEFLEGGVTGREPGSNPRSQRDEFFASQLIEGPAIATEHDTQQRLGVEPGAGQEP